MSSSRLAVLALEAEPGLCRARLMSCALGHVFLRRWTSLGFLRAWEKVGARKREGRNEKTERERERKSGRDVSRSEAPGRSASEETQPPASDKEHCGASCR